MDLLSLNYTNTQFINIVTKALFIILLLGSRLYGGYSQVNGVAAIPLDKLRIKTITTQDTLPKVVNKYDYLTISNIFDFNALSPFCKMEHFANRQARLPVKFRLGSVQYVDKLESK